MKPRIPVAIHWSEVLLAAMNVAAWAVTFTLDDARPMIRFRHANYAAICASGVFMIGQVIHHAIWRYRFNRRDS